VKVYNAGGTRQPGVAKGLGMGMWKRGDRRVRESESTTSLECAERAKA
jgi:hypothetical protein